MFIFTYPLRYVAIRTDRGSTLLFRDALAVLIITTVLSLPFIFTDANFFGDSGFLDRFSAFCGILTGFYIAALVGVASFVNSLGDLDKEIEVGKVTVKDTKGDDIPLTRRQYVSAMFGYLAFISLILSVSAIVLVVVSEHAAAAVPEWVGYGVIVAFNMVVGHMIVTTFHGLYYFIDRLYDKEPVPLAKPKRDDN